MMSVCLCVCRIMGNILLLEGRNRLLRFGSFQVENFWEKEKDTQEVLIQCRFRLMIGRLFLEELIEIYLFGIGKEP